MAAVLKTAMGRELHRGFESHTLRSYVRKRATDLLSYGSPARLGFLGLVRLYASDGGPARVAAANTRSVFSGRFVDAALGFILLSGNALGVHPEQDVNAVTSPL